MKYLFIFAIKIYQKTLSPDHGLLKYKYPYGYCRFYPTCSQYAIESFKSSTLPKAFIKTIIRIIKCNPFSAPGIDKPNKL